MAKTMRAMGATGDGVEMTEIPKPTPGRGDLPRQPDLEGNGGELFLGPSHSLSERRPPRIVVQIGENRREADLGFDGGRVGAGWDDDMMRWPARTGFDVAAYFLGRTSTSRS